MSVTFQILRDLRKVRGLQARSRETEEAQTTTRDSGYSALATSRHTHTARRPGDRGETGQAGTTQERTGDVSGRLHFIDLSIHLLLICLYYRDVPVTKGILERYYQSIYNTAKKKPTTFIEDTKNLRIYVK